MFDLIVITAANAAQAKGYRAQLKGRARFVVVPDPGDRRVGSLGATVNVLRRLGRLAPALGTDPDAANLSVKCHVGRASSPCVIEGSPFHLPGRGRPGHGPYGHKSAALGTDPCRARVLICHSGGDARRTPAYAAMGKAFVPMADGRPMLDHIVEAMEKLPKRPGVTVCCGDVIPRLDYSKVRFSDGVCGVAYPDGPWQAQRHGVYVEKNGLVTDFLQKPQVKRGRFLIDTGILHIDWATAERMKRLPIAGDIYEEFPKLLLGGFAPFHVSVVPTCEFFHIGSSRELLALLGKKGRLVDACRAPIGTLAGDNIVTNVPASYGTVNLAKGECLTCLPLGKSGWYPLAYRIDDNFKSDGLWEKHGLGAKMKTVNHARLLAIRVPTVDRTVRVTAPVRIDFAGGWSDTPPICQIEGGTVLAAAVTLEGRRPIEVTVRERKDKFVRVVSKDLGLRRLLKSAAEIADHHDPHDWCCLVKSALTVTGFRFGERGLDITISADLPKGSGMGTSSILGAATIAALLGRTDAAEVGELTLRLEQEMRTGGGWQDQFAGLLPGMKIMRSKPGRRQVVGIDRIRVPEKAARELKARSLLYFTGQKRMARNILRKVLSFYAENPHNFAKILVDSLKANAERCAGALTRGDLKAFADCVNSYWRDKRLLDPGSTNERVDEIVAAVSPHTSAVTLCGAGGGGFMYLLAKSAADAGRIRRLLERNPPSRYSRFYDFDFDDRGLVLE